MQSKRIMWAASALVLLAGCQKTPQSGQIVRFTAVSQPAVLTKVQYTGELAGGGTKERIDWKKGDAIRIYSSGAKASNDPSYTWADYAVTADGTELAGAVSQAEISVTSAQGGLAWGTGTNTFYAIYPSPGSPDAAGTVKGNTLGTSFNCTIPTSQEGTAISVKDLSNQTGPNIDVYYPNASAYHLAYNSLTEPAMDAPLAFDPAYTAFHISAGRKDTDITIKSVTLKAASGNAVAGDFTAYYGGSGWTFGCPAYASGSNVTFTFAGGNPVLTTSNPKVEFVLYALPQDLTNLTLDFLVDVDGVGTDLHRTLELKTAAAGTYNGRTYTAGQSLIFTACKKSYIKGLLIPGSTWTVDNTTPVVLRESVAPWDDKTDDITYGSGPVVNASGLDQKKDASDHWTDYTVSIYAPEGERWKIEVLGTGSDGVTLTQEDIAPAINTGTKTLEGTIGSPAKIHFTLSGSTGGNNCTLSFSVITDKGGANQREYSINSEVTRNRWGSAYQYINLP